MKTELYALISNYINERYKEHEKRAIFSELATLIEMSYLQSDNSELTKSDYGSVQRRLSVINEKESIRKKKGVYYTPLDLVNFIINNTVKELYGVLTPDNLSDSSLDAIEVEDFCFKKTCYDPTCGTGEF